MDTQSIHIASGLGRIEDVRRMLDSNPSLLGRVNGFYGTPLHTAAQFGQLEVAELLVSRGAEVDRVCKHGTPIGIAAETGALDIARLLISNGARASLQDAVRLNDAALARQALSLISGSKRLHEAARALQTACEVGADAVVALLLDTLSQAKPVWLLDTTPLHTAAGRGLDDTVKTLLAYGYDADALDRNERSPLHLACKAGQAGAAKLLIEAGADVSLRAIDGRTPMRLSCAAKHWRSMQLLLKNGAEITLGDAVAGGYVREARSLLRSSPSHDPGELSSCLRSAVLQGDLELTQMLLDAGASTEQMPIHGWTSSSFCDVSHGSGPCVRALIAHGYPADMHTAAALGLADRIRQLAANDPSCVDAPNPNTGWRPLSCAVQAGQTDAVRLLLECGASPDGTFEPPLEYVKLPEHREIATLLIRGGATVNVRCAARLGMMDVLRKLLEDDPGRVNSRNITEQTALHMAVLSRQHDAARLLIEAGANLDSIDDQDETPLTAAVRVADLEATEMLLKAGAHPDGPIPLLSRPIQCATYRAFTDDVESVARLMAIARALISHGAHVTIRDAAAIGDLALVRCLATERPSELDHAPRYEDRPIFHALREGHVQVADFLLSQGCGLRPALPRWSSYMEVARCYDQRRSALWLLEHGVSLDLHTACWLGEPDAVSALLEQDRLAIEDRDHRERTALHYAAISGDPSLVGHLLRTGADPFARDSMNLLPAGLAERNGNSEAYRLLRRAMGPAV